MKHPDLPFEDREILKAKAIVRIFETGSARGRYSALAVLDDGAGISYGISQFTHRSGSLLKVVEQYLANGGAIGAEVLKRNIPALRTQTAAAVNALASNRDLRSALKEAASAPEMRSAQEAVADEMYLLPAIRACGGSGFVLPLSLAVIYDSITHGSYALIRDRVKIAPGEAGWSDSIERSWITAYVRRRDAWLNSISRLRTTRYRTRFFLDRIAIGEWQLNLPLNVNGVWLTDKDIDLLSAQTDEDRTAAEPYLLTPKNKPPNQLPPQDPLHPTLDPQARQHDSGSLLPTLDEIEERIDRIAAKYDQTERIANKALTRTDRAKSLWATIAGTLWQTGWAVFGIMAGLPREVWLFVAITAAALTLIYLYRQISLGKIRESLPDTELHDHE